MRFISILFLVIMIGCSTTAPTLSTSTIRKVKDSPMASSQLFQLADPILTIGQRLFEENTKINLTLDFPNTSIYYTLDNTEPTENSQRYSDEIVITKSGTLKAKAFHPNHLASNTITGSFLKIGKTPLLKEATLSVNPHKNYKGKGTPTLFDKEKGSLNFRTDEWLGFKGEDVEILVALKKENKVNQLTVSTLSDVGSWIFPPSAIEIWSIGDGNSEQLIKKNDFVQPQKGTSPNLKYLTLDFPLKEIKNLKIIIRNNGPIPDWHDGKGTPAWLFLDEVILN